MTTTYIEPGSPWENPFVESFNGRCRDELLNMRSSAASSRPGSSSKPGATSHNTRRLHSSIAYMTPDEKEADWHTDRLAA